MVGSSRIPVVVLQLQQHVGRRYQATFTSLLLVLALLLVSVGKVQSSTPSSSSSSSSSTTSSSSSSTTSSSAVRKLAATEAPNVLNVHVVPHTHDDVGWRKTVEQYYYGYNNTMERCGAVHEILTTTMQALMEHPSRTFTYAEMKFFSMWWFNQTDAMKDTVRFLIANQQLTFVNGGWCMHDEATTHYIGMIDQTTLGHQFLLQELGVIPVTGWQLDPFGHSSTHAKLLVNAAGMNAVYFGRIDYQDLMLRQNQSRCEGLWKPNGNNNNDDEWDDSTIFWGLTGSYGGNYNPPPGFCFDVLCDDEPLVGANTTRLRQRIDDFLRKIKVQSDQTIDNHIMLTFGEDFTFREAHVDYSNIDVLIGSVMNYQLWNMVNISSMFGPRYDRVNIFYSNPDYYTQQKRIYSTRTDAKKWSVKTDDFFPYSDCPHCFWTGYYTSRAALKRYERVASSFLLAARQIDALATLSQPPEHRSDSVHTDIRSGPLYPLEDAVSIVQHHDAVAGTAKQHVADDYSKKLAYGIETASHHIINQIKSLMLDEKGPHLDNLSYCPLLNETICEISTNASSSNDTIIYVFVYNPLAHYRSTIVRLPVASEAMFRVERVNTTGSSSDDDDNNIRSYPSVVKESPLLNDAKKYELVFSTGPLPPLGIVVFGITKEAERDLISMNFASSRIKTRRLRNGSQESLELHNGIISATFDVATGLLTEMSEDGVVVSVNQTWGYYTSFDSTVDSTIPSQNSGAYIFRPSVSDQKLIHLTPKRNAAKFLPTPVGIDVYAYFEEPWVWQVTRVQNNSTYIEVEYVVGPVPIDDKRGKEIVTRYSTPIQSNGEFFTDSNGREFQKRKRNYRPTWNLDVYEPVAGNFYPVNAAIYVEDSTSAFAILVDRSQGGASLTDGSIEIMVQRRTLSDDSRGVDEPLNETCGGMTPYPPYGIRERIGDGVILAGKYLLRVGKGWNGASIAQSGMDDLFADPMLFIGSTLQVNRLNLKSSVFNGLDKPLPQNIMLITFCGFEQSKLTYLVRLGHQRSDQDSSVKPEIIDFSSIFSFKNITSIVELTASGNQELLTAISTSRKSEKVYKSTDSAQFELLPMVIRTFKVVISG